MLARRLLSRLSTVQSCQNVISHQMKVIPFTCRTTSLVRQISCTVCKLKDTETKKKYKYKYSDDPAREGRSGYKPRHIDPIDSVRYLESEAYRDVYKDEPVWVPYRKNTKGNLYPPIRTTCIRSGVITTGSACPICRDDYLVFDYRNVKLLKQFIFEDSLEPRNIRQVGLCKKQMKKLQLEVAKAQDYGYLEKYFPLRHYEEEYYEPMSEKNKTLTSNNKSTEETSVNQAIDGTSSNESF